jgi:hypothetical protein
MIIAILAAAFAVAACVAEAERRACVGRRMVNAMRSYEPPSTIRILGTDEELQSALQRMSEAERLKARQSDTRADHYAAVSDSFTGSRVVISAIPPVRASA